MAWRSTLRKSSSKGVTVIVVGRQHLKCESDDTATNDFLYKQEHSESANVC